MMNIDLNIWHTHFKYDDNKKNEPSQHKKIKTKKVLKSQQKAKQISYMSNWTIIRKFQ